MYRPIQLLTLFTEVFEKVMYSRLMENLYINKILVEEQFEFRQNLATQEAI
jgi:hypothetical protein